MESKSETNPPPGLKPEQRLELWRRCAEQTSRYPELDLTVDWTRVDLPAGFLADRSPLLGTAFREMRELEAGAEVNRDEGRMVGHYWLRAPELAPTTELTDAIRRARADVEGFAARVHAGEIQGATGPFRHVLLIGIGGSALGPQFVDAALGDQGPLPPARCPRLHFFDNTDPDGMDQVLARLEGKLGETLAVVISKSGGTKETANGMMEAKSAWEQAGYPFAKHAVAVTQAGSTLDERARSDGWPARFPMWDWVGGRTSETAAVGLLPAALQGVDIGQLLAGAAACDRVTRTPEFAKNPAAQLALLWHYLGDGHGRRDMVVIPYKDRLALFSRYLQQLVMESLGKERDRDGRVVHQGLAVYGNKGSTDQHAYVQQLREGLANFFVVFIEVLKDREGQSINVEPEGDGKVTSGDYLSGFLLGTRDALYEKDRPSITLTIDEVTPFSVGVLIALFERAVSFYASMIHINAYHQPGVQAGKLAADEVLALQRAVVARLAREPERAWSAEELAAELGKPCEAERVYKICEHLSRNPGRGVTRVQAGRPAEARYSG